MVDETGRVGSSFEDYLREQGTLEETTTAAVKRILAWQERQESKRNSNGGGTASSRTEHPSSRQV